MLYADFNYLKFDNITYSVDMLRLRTDITVSQFSYIIERLKLLYPDVIDDYYMSFSISSFKYNYVIKYDVGVSFWFGFVHNSEIINKNNSLLNDNNKYNFTIEFNPNKVPLRGFLKFLFRYIKKWVVKSVDLAIDIPVNILDLCGFDKGRKKDIRIFSKGFDDCTYYIGRGNNRIKIYNKKIESCLDYELTRVEISSKLDLELKNLFFYNYNINLPDIYLNEYLYTFKDYEDKTLLAVLFAVQNGFNINDLSRRYKEKVKNLLNGGYKINFYNKYCTDVIKKCLCYIFNIENGI